MLRQSGYTAWGDVRINGNSTASVSVTFPTAYASAPIVSVAGEYSGESIVLKGLNVSATGFSVTICNKTSGAIYASVSWQAFGFTS